MNITSTTGSVSFKSPQTLPTSTSKWGIGWRTPLIIFLCYFIAIFIACTHLALFIYLDGKPADGKGRVAPQSYITTASSILAALFELSLKSSLVFASTQYLWYILRRSALKVSTIESLFTLQSNPFLLFNKLVLIDAYILTIIAVLIWSIQVVVSFPPGALTIGSVIKKWTQNQSVPTFNASFFGNSSGYDANRYSFLGFYSIGSNLTITPNLFFNDSSNTPDIRNLAEHTLINGNPTIMLSPCNSNCSFTLAMDVPYVECNSTSATFTSLFSPFLTSNAIWEDAFTATWSDYILNITTYYTIFPSGNTTGTAKTNNNICAPARAMYTLDILYENNIQSINYSLVSVTSLNITSPAPPPVDPTFLPNAVFPGFISRSNGGVQYYELQALNWTEQFVSWYRDLQLMTLVDGMARALAGYIEFGGLGNGTVVANSRFNHAFSIYPQPLSPTLNTLAAATQAESSVSVSQFDQYTITQDSLNQALLNITLSAIVDFGWWQTDTIVKKWQSINVYEFSRPLNLLIPYFLSLFLSIPILVLGSFALQRNGVSATNGGFIQLISTSTGSSTLNKLVAGGCLGGDENIPQELKDLKIRFGEIVSEGEKGLVRRAGFGTEKEVRPLRKGALYG